MPIFLPLLLAAQVSPEVAAVQDRARREAAEKRAPQAQAARLPVPPAISARFQACVDAAADDADKGLQVAGQWLVTGGGFYARQCQGFALARTGRWTAAQVAFEQAANAADIARDPAAGRLWAQVGNAALAGGDYAKARSSFDAAIARGLANGIDKGEAYLDRARAAVALGDMTAARADLDKAVEQVPADPLAWLLSATLARRTGNLGLAEKHIAEAVRLSPDDAAVALEEGNIAVLGGKDEAAKTAWSRAVKLAADSNAGKAAAANLGELAKAPAPPRP